MGKNPASWLGGWGENDAGKARRERPDRAVAREGAADARPPRVARRECPPHPFTWPPHQARGRLRCLRPRAVAARQTAPGQRPGGENGTARPGGPGEGKGPHAWPCAAVVGTQGGAELRGGGGRGGRDGPAGATRRGPRGPKCPRVPRERNLARAAVCPRASLLWPTWGGRPQAAGLWRPAVGAPPWAYR